MTRKQQQQYKDAKINFRGLGGPPNMLDKQPFIMLEFMMIPPHHYL